MLTSRFRILIAVCAALMTLGALLTPAAGAPAMQAVEDCANYANYDNGKGQGIPFKSERECARYVNKGGTLQPLPPAVTITYAGSGGACLATVTVRGLPNGTYQPEVYYSIENKGTGFWEDVDTLYPTQPESIAVSDGVGTFTFETNGAYSDPHPKTGVFMYHTVIVADVSSGLVPVMGC